MGEGFGPSFWLRELSAEPFALGGGGERGAGVEADSGDRSVRAEGFEGGLQGRQDGLGRALRFGQAEGAAEGVSGLQAELEVELAGGEVAGGEARGKSVNKSP